MSETYETTGPRCPYCQHLHRADEPFFYNESMDEMDCEHCAKTFSVMVYSHFSWTCAAIEEADSATPNHEKIEA